MATKKKVAAVVPWNERLDAAVMRRWPEVTCETHWGLFSMQWVSRWWQAGTEDTKLKPALARQVQAFVAGFMESENFHNA